jgi:hypothetical protein
MLREVGYMCGISKSSVFNILTEDLDMSRVCVRWVLRSFKKCRLCVTKTSVFRVSLIGPCGLHTHSKYADNFVMRICFVYFNVLWSISNLYRPFLLLTLLYRKKLHMSTNFLDNPRIYSIEIYMTLS